MLRDALSHGGSANIFYLPMVTKVDIFGLGSARYDEVEFARRRRVRVCASGEELWFKSPEDTILRKLWWYREGGAVSGKQWRDVRTRWMTDDEVGALLEQLGPAPLPSCTPPRVRRHQVSRFRQV